MSDSVSGKSRLDYVEVLFRFYLSYFMLAFMYLSVIVNSKVDLVPKFAYKRLNLLHVFCIFNKVIDTERLSRKQKTFGIKTVRVGDSHPRVPIFITKYMTLEIT